MEEHVRERTLRWVQRSRPEWLDGPAKAGDLIAMGEREGLVLLVTAGSALICESGTVSVVLRLRWWERLEEWARLCLFGQTTEPEKTWRKQEG